MDCVDNMQVIREGEGELIIARRSKEDIDLDLYGPCPMCLQWMKDSERYIANIKNTHSTSKSTNAKKRN